MMSEANKELVRRHFEEIWNRDLHMHIEAIVAEGDLVAMLQLGVVQPPGRPPA